MNKYTQIVSQWIIRDDFARQFAYKALEDAKLGRGETREVFAGLLHLEMQSYAPEPNGLYTVLLNEAMSEVNWLQVGDELANWWHENGAE